LKTAQHLRQLCAVYKFEWFALGESQSLVGVNAAGDEHRPVSFFRRHDAEKLPDWLDTHLVRLPPFALHDGGRAVALESEVNAAVRTTPADFLHLITALPIHLGHLPLEVLPTELVQPVDIQMLLEEGSPLLAEVPSGHTGSEADYGRNGTQNDSQYLNLRNLDGVLEPNHRYEEDNHRDRDAPRRMNHAEKPAQGFKKVVPQISSASSRHSVNFWVDAPA
jgi:hypothetical protein